MLESRLRGKDTTVRMSPLAHLTLHPHPNRQGLPQTPCICPGSPHLPRITSISAARSLDDRKLSTARKPWQLPMSFLFFGLISRCDDSPTRACYICTCAEGDFPEFAQSRK
jgi:hypothetical protein